MVEWIYLEGNLHGVDNETVLLSYGRRFRYFFISDSNLVIPRRIASARLTFSCSM